MIRGAVKDKVKVKTTDVSRFFFGATNVSLRCCCRCGYPYDVRDLISQQSQIRVAAVATLLAVYMTLWSGLGDTQIISPILAAFSKINN